MPHWFARQMTAPEVTKPAEPQLRFPAVTPTELRKDRLRSFWVAAGAAVVPYFIGLVWRFTDGLTTADFFKGVPDLAFATVVISLSAFVNTMFSFATLDGYRRAGNLTFFLAFMLLICAIFAFVTYMRVIHSPPKDDELLFLTCATLTIAAFLFSYSLQHSFVSDECRSALEARSKLSGPGESG